jgi:2-polyprenyl-3-methyl-5-hydroxy-6-metoxy-1,4-benzoquinol methylase
MATSSEARGQVRARPCPACGAETPRDAGTKDSWLLVRCRSCQTLFTAELPSSETLHEYYGHYYGQANLSPPAFVARRLDEITGGFAPHRQNGRLLDVGCGAAMLLEAARRGGWTAEGTEVSEVAVANARERGFNVFLGGLAQAQFPTGHYDVVTAVEVLEHVLDPSSLLREMARILRRDGLLWITTPHSRGISARLLGTSWSVVSPPEHVQLFSARGLKHLLGVSGFDRVRIAAHGVNPIEIVRHFHNGANVAANDRLGAGYELNEQLSASPSRRILKRALNAVLSGTRLGDSLKIYATNGGPR